MEADKQEKTHNQLIAEFMGLMVFKTHEEMRAVPLNELKEWAFQDQIDYHANWSNLMPVVEKIESIERTLVNIYGDATVIAVDDSEGMEVYGATTHGNKDNKISHVYRAVVEFIHWHNSKKPLPL